MGTWNTAPQVPNVPGIPNGEPDLAYIKTLHEYIKKMTNVLSILKNDLEFMINGNLDVKNIRAKSITADRLKVDELSAISANLGHIVAGLIESIEIYGSYIATAQGTYPRCEMSATDNLFGAYGTSTKFINIVPDSSGIPIMELRNGSMRGFIQPLLNSLYIATSGGSGNVEISSGADVYLHAQGLTRVDSWTKLYSNGDSQSLQTALNSKATLGNSTSSDGGTTLNGGIPIGTQLMVNGGGTVTWSGISIPAHSHTQT